MGHNMATWKILEDLMLTLKKKGADIPANVIEDLRSAKSMIQLTCMEDSRGEIIQKAEEYTANVEAYLITETQKTLGSEAVDEWLRRLEEANIEVCQEKQAEENKFVVRVPRDQKWTRIEPTSSLPAERLEKIAEEMHLSVNKQNDGRIVVFGKPDDVKAFIKQMTTESVKK
jgi:hypothetical protein